MVRMGQPCKMIAQVPVELQQSQLLLLVAGDMLAGHGFAAHHFLVADGADKPAGGAGRGIFGAGKQDLAGDVVAGLGGACGAVGGLRAERYGALRGRQQAGIAAVVGRRARGHGGRQVAPAAEDAATAQGPARGHDRCGRAGSAVFMGDGAVDVQCTAARWCMHGALDGGVAQGLGPTLGSQCRRAEPVAVNMPPRSRGRSGQHIAGHRTNCVSGFACLCRGPLSIRRTCRAPLPSPSVAFVASGERASYPSPRNNASSLPHAPP
jgi:hypothetical protein